MMMAVIWQLEGKGTNRIGRMHWRTQNQYFGHIKHNYEARTLQPQPNWLTGRVRERFG
jgi:hypothetical protein